jgi:hypothetical protein
MNRRSFFRAAVTGVGAAAACVVAARAPACNIVVDLDKPLRDARIAAAIRAQVMKTDAAIAAAKADMEAISRYIVIARDTRVRLHRMQGVLAELGCSVDVPFPAIEAPVCAALDSTLTTL